MSLTASEIKEVLTLLEESGWAQARITIGDVTLSVSRGGDLLPATDLAPAATAAAAVAEALVPAARSTQRESAAGADPTAVAPLAGTTVCSPSVGVFWRAPQPGAPAFVEVNDEVKAGDTLCIVEVMKLMTHVAAPVAGVVVAIHVSNGDALEHGSTLFTITPPGA